MGLRIHYVLNYDLIDKSNKLNKSLHNVYNIKHIFKI